MHVCYIFLSSTWDLLGSAKIKVAYYPLQILIACDFVQFILKHVFIILLILLYAAQ